MKEASSEARKATRFATSSEVPRRPWAGCVSGALEKDEYERLLSEASFQEVSVEVTQTYDEEFDRGPQGRRRGAQGREARCPGPRPLRPHKGEDGLHDG
jgi:hypothetical protein